MSREALPLASSIRATAMLPVATGSVAAPRLSSQGYIQTNTHGGKEDWLRVMVLNALLAQISEKKNSKYTFFVRETLHHDSSCDTDRLQIFYIYWLLREIKVFFFATP